jgi:glycosyltransferase involved in cell wall biosynthesis
MVMNESLAAGIPVIGARYGALAERIRTHGCGWTIDPMHPDGIRVLVERLDRSRDELVRVTRRVLQVPLAAVDEVSPRYAALYRT